MLFAAENIETGNNVIFSMDDVFDGKVTKDKYTEIRLAKIADRNYPRV